MPKFKKGSSGNPNGRPKGTGNAKKLREAIADDIPSIIEAMVEKAKNGDSTAAKILLDRSIPALRPIHAAVTVDGLKSESPTEQGKAVVAAMGSGQLSADQAQSMLSGIANFMKIVEVDELEKRITILEDKSK